MQFYMRFARLALLGASICCIPVALYAADPADADEAQQVQEVIVTGSRIPVPAGVTSTSPITSVSTQEIQLQGHTDMTDVLNELPQAGIFGGVDFGNTSKTRRRFCTPIPPATLDTTASPRRGLTMASE
jgi:outer membrane cobalamin receptor